MSPPPYSLKGKAKDLGLEYYPGINLDRDPAHSLLYNLKARELADNLNEAGDRKGNVAFCDTRTPMEKAALEDSPGDLEGGLFKYLRDGVHLSPDGYQVCGRNLFEVASGLIYLACSACTKLFSMLLRAGSQSLCKSLTFLQTMSKFLPHEGSLTLNITQTTQDRGSYPTRKVFWMRSYDNIDWECRSLKHVACN